MLQRDVLHMQRLTVKGRFDSAEVADQVKNRIAATVGLPSAKALDAHLSDLRARVRAIFNAAPQRLRRLRRMRSAPALRRAGKSAGRRGRSFRCRGAERMRSDPPCISTSERAIARPRPGTLVDLVELALRPARRAGRCWRASRAACRCPVSSTKRITSIRSCARAAPHVRLRA